MKIKQSSKTIMKTKDGTLIGLGMNIHQKVGRNRLVRRLIQKYEETGPMDRRSGTGRPRSVSTKENEELVEELISSQKEPGTHTHPRTIAEELDVSHSAIRRMIKDSGYNQFERLKTPSSNEGTQQMFHKDYLEDTLASVFALSWPFGPLHRRTPTLLIFTSGML